MLFRLLKTPASYARDLTIRHPAPHVQLASVPWFTTGAECYVCRSASQIMGLPCPMRRLTGCGEPSLKALGVRTICHL
ncbi:unnamed protein product [Closterium sp. Yama58-4]|nr:unnamed protein product [Closterium sp. Yama58-4]